MRPGVTVGVAQARHQAAHGVRSRLAELDVPDPVRLQCQLFQRNRRAHGQIRLGCGRRDRRAVSGRSLSGGWGVAPRVVHDGGVAGRIRIHVTGCHRSSFVVAGEELEQRNAHHNEKQPEDESGEQGRAWGDGGRDVRILERWDRFVPPESRQLTVGLDPSEGIVRIVAVGHEGSWLGGRAAVPRILRCIAVFPNHAARGTNRAEEGRSAPGTPSRWGRGWGMPWPAPGRRTPWVRGWRRPSRRAACPLVSPG